MYPFYGNSQVNQSFGVGSTIKYYDNEWGYNKEDLPPIEDFDPDEEYTPYELDRFADAWLWEDEKPSWHDPVILMHEHMHERRKKEIYNHTGTPDLTLMNELSPDGHRMYWRTHPGGRKVNSLEQRQKNGQGFYR